MLRHLLAALLATGACLAQTLVVPAAASGSDAAGSTPWPLDVQNLRIVYVYDSTHFTNQGVHSPVLLTGFSLRANGPAASWAGCASVLQVDLSTAPFDYTAISTTFADNHGADRTTVRSGPLVTPPGQATGVGPGPFYANVPFSQPFLYDPNAGDLVIEYVSSGVTPTSMPTLDMELSTGIARARRVHSTNPNDTEGALWPGEAANVMQFAFTPPPTLLASFASDVTTGPSPLQVHFTDRSFSPHPSGITNWAWDLDGDGAIDSTAQNPAFLYTACGDYTVSLTVGDASGQVHTVTRTRHVRVDEAVLAPSFSTSLVGGTIVQFQDTTTPTPTRVEWDFDGDQVTDAVGSTAVHAFPALCAPATVTQRTFFACRGPFVNTQEIAVGTRTADVVPSASSGTQSATWVGVFLDVVVHAPLGVNVCALTMNTYAFAGPYVVHVYVTDGSYFGKDLQPDRWRRIGEGTGTASAAGTSTAPVRSLAAMQRPFHLPAGTYGLAIYLDNPNGAAGISYSNATFGTTGNADLSFYPDQAFASGIARNAWFAGSSFGPPRVWNGEVHYSDCASDGSPGYGWFGPGCGGTLPVANNLATALPRVGRTMALQFTNAPSDLGLVFLGFSRASSPTLGSLPVDLGLVGMPNCAARVDPGSSWFVVGAGGVLPLALAIPNDPAFVCLPFYTQAFVFDATANAFGGVVSDAAAAVVGN